MKLFPSLLMCLLAGPIWADVLDLKYGVNELDINADGVKDVIVRSRWDIMNAHSSDRFLVLVNMHPDSEPQNPVMPFEARLLDDPRQDFSTLEGADCVLGAYVFSRDTQGMLHMKHYTRPEGESFSAAYPVTITDYALTKSEEKISDNEGYGRLPGSTFWAFTQVSKTTTKKRYCDVRNMMTKDVAALVRDDR